MDQRGPRPRARSSSASKNWARGAPRLAPDPHARSLPSPRAACTSSLTPEDTGTPPAGCAARAPGGHLASSGKTFAGRWLWRVRGQRSGAGPGGGGGDAQEAGGHLGGQPPSLLGKRGQEGVGARGRCTGAGLRTAPGSNHAWAQRVGALVTEPEGAEGGSQQTGRVRCAWGGEVGCQAQRGSTSSDPVLQRSLRNRESGMRKQAQAPRGPERGGGSRGAFNTLSPVIVSPSEMCLLHTLDPGSHYPPMRTRNPVPSLSPCSAPSCTPAQGLAFEACPRGPPQTFCSRRHRLWPDSCRGCWPAPCTEAWVSHASPCSASVVTLFYKEGSPTSSHQGPWELPEHRAPPASPALTPFLWEQPVPARFRALPTPCPLSGLPPFM